MSKFETEQQTKIVNSYGGIGSLIQTRENGSLLIENFDEWLYYQANFIGAQIPSDEKLIQDDRLLVRLREQGFKNIEGLFRLPENEDSFGMTRVAVPNNVISARFFPEWFFCPVCRKLKHLKTWQDGALNNNYYPVCNCQNNQRNRLEQIRFVLVSDAGELCDVPWNIFFNDAGNDIEIDTENPIPIGNYSLYLSVGGTGESLESIKITNYDKNGNLENNLVANKRIKSLGSLYSVRFKHGKTTFSVQLRQSNSICYVKTISSIFIPELVIPIDEIKTIEKFRRRNPAANVDEILNDLKFDYPDTKTTPTMMEAHLNPPEPEESEEKYRFDEYKFFNQAESNDKDLKFKQIAFDKFGLSHLYQIRKLKVTTLQTDYSRLTPEGAQMSVGPIEARYFPAVEMYGEGILFQFNGNKLKKVLEEIFSPEDFERIANLLVHTFSHIIMKELEFECGYSVSSMKERLYVMENNYAVLIYAVSGGDSSMGGLTALFDKLPLPDGRMKIELLIANAILRAKDCSNDPICSTTRNDDHQNEAVCYSCCLIPEISCEKFNTSLNRNILNNFYDFIGRD